METRVMTEIKIVTERTYIIDCTQEEFDNIYRTAYNVKSAKDTTELKNMIKPFILGLPEDFHMVEVTDLFDYEPDKVEQDIDESLELSLDDEDLIEDEVVLENTLPEEEEEDD